MPYTPPGFQKYLIDLQSRSEADFFLWCQRKLVHTMVKTIPKNHIRTVLTGRSMSSVLGTLARTSGKGELSDSIVNSSSMVSRAISVASSVVNPTFVAGAPCTCTLPSILESTARVSSGGISDFIESAEGVIVREPTKARLQIKTTWIKCVRSREAPYFYQLGIMLISPSQTAASRSTGE